MSGAIRSINADESLVNVQKTLEPSMEEILASIRSLIADDSGPEAPKAATGPSAEPFEPEAERSAEAEQQLPRVVWSRPAALNPPPPVFPRPIPAARPVEPPPEPEPEPDALLSEESDDAAMSSFAALNAALELRSSDIAERMVGELLRPMLKGWLDENLPSIVEKLVRAEIQRVARGRG